MKCRSAPSGRDGKPGSEGPPGKSIPGAAGEANIIQGPPGLDVVAPGYDFLQPYPVTAVKGGGPAGLFLFTQLGVPFNTLFLYWNNATTDANGDIELICQTPYSILPGSPIGGFLGIAENVLGLMSPLELGVLSSNSFSIKNITPLSPNTSYRFQGVMTIRLMA